MLVPFSLRLTPPVRLLLFSVSDDPVYCDVEVQWVDDARWGGSGAVVLAVRHDGTADVHVDERLQVPREDYEIGAGIGAFVSRPMSPCRFDITDQGAQVALGLRLADGRPMSLSVHEARRTPRPHIRMLAPAGHAMENPRFLPFFWMDDIWFLLWRGARVQVHLGDEARRVVRVGVPWRLARYASAPMTALWCEAATASVPSVPDSTGEHSLESPAQDHVAGASRAPDDMHGRAVSASSTIRVVEDGGRAAVRTISVHRDASSLEVRFDPPFPDLSSVGPTAWEGRWTAWASGRAQFGGTCRADRDGDRVRLVLTVDVPWDPGPQPFVASWVFRVLGVFRTWPTTYLWNATVDLSTDPPFMASTWTRTTG